MNNNKQQKLVNSFFNTVINNLKYSKSNFIRNNNLTASYNQIYNKIEKINYEIGSLNGARIAVFSDKSFNYYASVLSVILSKNIWIQFSPSMPIKRIKQIISISNIKHAIYDESFNNKKVLEIKKINFIKLSKILKKNKKKNIQKIKPDPNKTSMIFFTSGSTGLPKGVEISYINFISCLFHQIKNLKYRRNKEIFSDYHDPSFVMSVVIIFPAVFLNSQISPLIDSVDKLFPTRHMIENKISALRRIKKKKN